MSGNLNFLKFLEEKRGIEIPLIIKITHHPEDIKETDFDGLNVRTIFNILNVSDKKNETILFLLQYKNFIKHLIDEGVYWVLELSTFPEILIDVLLKNETFVENLNEKSIKWLLKYTHEPENIISILGQKGIDYVKNINEVDLRGLLYFSKEPEKLRLLFKDRL